MNDARTFDYVIVGAGSAGCTLAYRLSEDPEIRVLVLEAGRRYEDDDFAKTSWNLRKFLWAPALGCFGIQRIHLLRNVMILAGAGVGGGSLNYANTLYVPPQQFFNDPQWKDITDWRGELMPHYDQAQRMLGVVTNPTVTDADKIMQQVADEHGLEVSEQLGTPSLSQPASTAEADAEDDLTARLAALR